MTCIPGVLSVAIMPFVIVGCGKESTLPTGAGGQSVVATSVPSSTALADVVPLPPTVNWDSPVIDGLDASEETAQELAQVDFAIDVPPLSAKLLKIQSTNPQTYPEEMRGYGILFDVSASGDASDSSRLMIEETRATPDDPQFIRNIAETGNGYDLELVEGVEVVFIHPAESASAVLVFDEVKYNIYGRDLPLSIVRDAVETVVGNR